MEIILPRVSEIFNIAAVLPLHECSIIVLDGDIIITLHGA